VKRAVALGELDAAADNPIPPNQNILRHKDKFGFVLPKLAYSLGVTVPPF